MKHLDPALLHIGDKTLEQAEKDILEELKARHLCGMSLERMVELGKADAEGRIIVLPFKAGCTLWCNDVYFGDLCKGHVKEIRLWGKRHEPIFDCIFHSTLVNCDFTLTSRQISDIGKNVYFIKAEAQAALERIKRNGIQP